MQKITSGTELLEKIENGIETLAGPVASTLGPSGRTVALSDGKTPMLTKDGATVAGFITSNDPISNIATEIIKQASLSANSEVGDGSTTAVVLARRLFKEVSRFIITKDVNVSQIKRKIKEVSEHIVKEIRKLSRPVKDISDIEHVASISANDREIGKLISLAIEQAGMDGAVTIEPNYTEKTTLDIAEGFVYDGGYVTSDFITDERKGALCWDDPIFIVTNQKLRKMSDIAPIVEKVLVSLPKRPLVVIADQIDGSALAMMVLNTKSGVAKVAAIKPPSFGEERINVLEDLAIATGATFINVMSGMLVENAELKDLGSAKRIETTRFKTTIVGCNGKDEEVDKRKELIRGQLLEVSTNQEGERLQERLTRLSSAVATIRVGGLTEIEMNERKHRVEDALNAVFAAESEGVLPGGGVGILRAWQNYDLPENPTELDITIRDIMGAVCAEPLLQLITNSFSELEVFDEIYNSEDVSFGYNFEAKEYVDLIEDGIIDPAKVVITSLQNAVSAISTLLTISHSVTPISE